MKAGGDEALQAARDALAGQVAWLVGGVVRDRLLGRETYDLDLVVGGDVEASARKLARAVRGACFALGEAFGAWRVVAPGQAWQADFAPLGPGSIEDNLAQRDFTVNAIAEPLSGGEPVDPFGGLADARARRLRMVTPRALRDDPLRALRLPRLACELGFQADPDTLQAARAVAGALAGVAQERVFAEVKRIVVAPAVLDGLALMLDLGVTDVVLPELSGLRGVQQSRFHHLDVYEHTLAVLDALLELERDPEPVLGDHAPAVVALLAEPLADELTRAEGLRLGALLHDVAKPQTHAVTAEGRITFLGHDAQGAELARDALGRLRASERLSAHVAALVRHHLRLGFLVHERPLSRRAVYRYLRACEPVEVDVTVLSVVDRLATRGDNAQEAIAKHVGLARELLGEALAWRASGHPPPLIRGDVLADELAIEPGPELGLLLRELEEAQFAGEVSSPEQALALARRLRTSH